MGRLTSLTHAKGVTELLNKQSYVYDAIGRRIATTTSLAQPLVTPTVIAGVDPLSNRLRNHGGMTYTHDLNGNRLSETGPGGTTSYLWDGRNRLKSVTSPSGEVMRFRYDFAGNMIEQTKGADSKQFVLDSLSNVVFQSSSDGDQFSVLTGQSIDSHLGVVRNGTEVDYALTDGLNSTAAVSDETGAVNGTVSYEPFGATTQTGEAVPFQFTGRVRVSEGLYYYRARFYDANVGRFISEDPIGFTSGDANLYRYVGNDPVNFVDPTGEFYLEIFGLGVVGGGYLFYDSACDKFEKQRERTKKLKSIEMKMKSIEEMKKANGSLLEDYSKGLEKNLPMNIKDTHELTGEGFKFVNQFGKTRLLNGK